MSIKTEQDFTGICEIGHIVGYTLKQMQNGIREGMTTAQLDALGAEILADMGARPAPRLMYNFPGTTCISINNEIAHGIPGSRIIKEGDLVNIDVSAEKNGYFADNGGTVPFGVSDRRLLQLCECSRSTLTAAISMARRGTRINRVGRLIERRAKSSGFRVIENLCGHGVGRSLHEYPEEIPNYYDPTNRASFTHGMVVAIETFVSTGARYGVDGGDGWTIVTPDGSRVAQYEHTVIVTDGEPIIVTDVQ
jgi:methionyl aminopeptidase